jgi:transcriptional regulator with XRE-family HTH domain
MTTEELHELLRQECIRTSQRAVADKAGVSESLISQILSGKQKIGPKVAKVLGYRRRRIWVLDETLLAD